MEATKPLAERRAEEIMTRAVVTVPEEMGLREAAHALREAGVGGAPVVDAQGRCVGVISSFDFLRWAEGAGPARSAPCRYLSRGNPASGWGEWICVLAEGSCPYQRTQATTGGRHVSACVLPAGGTPLSLDGLPSDTVGRYMTTDLVTAGLGAKVPEVARMMVDAHIHRVVLLDAVGRPVGVVSTTDILAAVASESVHAPPAEAAKPDAAGAEAASRG